MFVNLKREKVAEERKRERERKQHSINNNKHPQQQQGIFFYSSWREFFVGFVWLVFYDFITPEIARLLYVSICLSSLSDCLRQARKIPTQLPLFLPLPLPFSPSSHVAAPSALALCVGTRRRFCSVLCVCIFLINLQEECERE